MNRTNPGIAFAARRETSWGWESYSPRCSEALTAVYLES
jgi:hypothetical protein